MKMGETVRLDCDECVVEFEVKLEPKTRPKDVGTGDDRKVAHCPFCGGTVSSDEE